MSVIDSSTVGLWAFKSSAWRQDTQGACFVLEQVSGEDLARLDPVISPSQLVGAKLHSAGSCGGAGKFLPEDFSFCPFCATPLAANDPGTAQPWMPPYGPVDGFRLLPQPLAKGCLTGMTGEKFPVPPLGEQFNLLSARMGAHELLLLALDRGSGRLWVLHTAEQAWKRLDGTLTPDEIPGWSWSVATDADGSGLLLADGGGLAWIGVDWPRMALRIDRKAGRPVGGALRVGDHAVAPLLVDGQFKMFARRDGVPDWSEIECAADPLAVEPRLCSRSDDLPFLGAPFLDANREVAYWPARGGYVRVAGLGGSGPARWTFRPWTNGAEPTVALIELGPPLRRPKVKGIWQLCEVNDERAVVNIFNKIIKYDGDDAMDAEIVTCGQFLSTGRSSFSWADDYWDDVQRRDSDAEVAPLRVPLLQFGEKGLVLLAKVQPWEGKGDVDSDERFSALFFNPRLRTRVDVRLVLENKETPERVLTRNTAAAGEASVSDWMRVSLSRLPELSVIIHDGWLFLYNPEANECFRWKMEFAAV